MKKTIVLAMVMALALSMVAPGVALAAKGSGKSGGKGKSSAASGQSADKSQAKADKAAARAERKAAQEEAKAARKADKEAAKAEKAAAKELLKTQRHVQAVAGEEGSGTVETSPSAEPTKAVGPGVGNAFTRITANIEKSLAKVAAGTKKQVPPGLVKVWLKFAGWLGIDPATMPGASSTEPTGTPEPTSTVEPTPTVEPTETVGAP